MMQVIKNVFTALIVIGIVVGIFLKSCWDSVGEWAQHNVDERNSATDGGPANNNEPNLKQRSIEEHQRHNNDDVPVVNHTHTSSVRYRRSSAIARSHDRNTRAF